MGSEKEIEKQAREAINQYLSTVSYPVLWSDGDRIVTLGTAVLFQYKTQHFLLTAKHLFDKFEGERFPYEGLIGPISLKKAAPTELGRILAHEAHGEDADFLDVIAIELLDEEFVSAIKRHWKFITVADFANPNAESVYFVSGFPAERERREGEMVGAALLSFTTEQTNEVPDLDIIKRYDPRFDIFCKYASMANDFYDSDKLVNVPWVGGVSGGPVFRVADEPANVWSPQAGTSFVGLQSAASTNKTWLHIKSAHAIGVYFEKQIPEIGAAILQQLGK